MIDLVNNGMDNPPPESKTPPTKTPASSQVDVPFSPPPPMYRRDFVGSDEQEQDDEARVIFNKTIGENHRRGKSGYLRVGVLFLTWEDDDLYCKSTEVISSRFVQRVKLIPHQLGE